MICDHPHGRGRRVAYVTIASHRASLKNQLMLGSSSDQLRLPVRWLHDRSPEEESGPDRPDPLAADGE